MLVKQIGPFLILANETGPFPDPWAMEAVRRGQLP